jgi:VCBS repeat-containing protein
MIATIESARCRVDVRPRFSRAITIGCLVLVALSPAAAVAGDLGPQFVSAPGPQIIVEGGNSGDLAVVLSDTMFRNVTLTATSSNTTLIPDADIVVTPPTGGEETYSRTLRVTPAAHRNVLRDNAANLVTITLEAAAEAGASTFATFTVDVTEINDPPQTIADVLAEMSQDGAARNVPVDSLRGNDDAGPLEAFQTLSVTAVDQATGGTIELSNDVITFTPTPGFSGSAGFRYTVTDNGDDNGVPSPRTATGDVTFDIVGTNDAPTFTLGQSLTLDEDAGTQTMTAFLTDASPGPKDESAQTLQIVVGTDSGALFSVAPDIDLQTGTLTFTPAADASGVANVFVTLIDDGGTANGGFDRSAQAFTIAMSPVADTPIAADDQYTVAEDEQLAVSCSADKRAIASCVLANDSDADGDLLTALLVSAPEHGVLMLSAKGDLAYTPSANFVGTDTFTYRADDTQTQSNIATVTITVTPVNDAPQGVGDNYTTGEDQTLDIVAPGVLGNDSDIEDKAITAVVDTAPAHGTLTLATDGGFRYVPAADYAGPDSFTYRANDAELSSSPITVTLAIGQTNDGPAADAQSLSTLEDTSLSIVFTGTDTEGDELTFDVTSKPEHGRLVEIRSAMTYRPDADFNGTDSFTFTANDGTSTSAPATVSITVLPVNDTPSFKAVATYAWKAGTSGQRSVQGWVTDVSFGPEDESTQTVSEFVVTPVSDPAGVLAGPVSIGKGDILQYVLSGAPGIAMVDVQLRDNGGTANGGNDTSLPLRLTIAVGQTAHLSITKDNESTSLGENDVVIYRIVASNDYQSAIDDELGSPDGTVIGARVTDPMPLDLVDVTWTCTGTLGAICPASGIGDIDALVDLPSGASVIFIVRATVRGTGDDVITNTAYITPPATMVDGDGSDNQATDSDDAHLFRDGMESVSSTDRE